MTESRERIEDSIHRLTVESHRLRLENTILKRAINELATNRLTFHFGAAGFFLKFHQPPRQSAAYQTALEAVLAEVE